MTQDLLIIKHHQAEGPGRILQWATQKDLCYTVIEPGDCLPVDATGYAAMILLGGPMSVNKDSPRLIAETALLKQFISAEKPLLGICLGAQLIAKTLGCEIQDMSAVESGWVAVSTKQGQLHVPQWHEEQIMPNEQILVQASSVACQVQLYTHQQHVVGIQFHPEWTKDSIAELQNNFDDCPLDDAGSSLQHQPLQLWLFKMLERWWQKQIVQL